MKTSTRTRTLVWWTLQFLIAAGCGSAVLLETPADAPSGDGQSAAPPIAPAPIEKTSPPAPNRAPDDQVKHRP